MYTKSWSAFDRLVAVVPPGGSIGSVPGYGPLYRDADYLRIASMTSSFPSGYYKTLVTLSPMSKGSTGLKLESRPLNSKTFVPIHGSSGTYHLILTLIAHFQVPPGKPTTVVPRSTCAPQCCQLVLTESRFEDSKSELGSQLSRYNF